MASVKTYDPKKVIIIFGGKTITGYTDGTFVNITPSGEGIPKIVGADGEIARSIDPDDTYEVALTLMQTSSSNDFLSASYEANRRSGGLMLPILIKDGTGRTLFSAAQAWVSGFPETGFGVTAEETREWTILTGEGIFVSGGNS